MKNFRLKPMTVAVSLALVTTVAYAATLYIKLDTPVVVSTDDPANNAYKAKMGWISYKSDPALTQYDVKAQVLVYADGPAGKQNIWIARSTDNGATWVQQQITTNGGATLTITDGATEDFFITHNKPNIYVAPVGMVLAGKGADALVTWTSSDCEGSAVQKINTNLLTGHQPYMCLWAARSTDGGLTWTKQRLTDGSLDPDEDVPAGYVKSDLTAGGFAISYQADPAGLQQGDAEGPGDGASGAKVSAGTNIWYTFLNKAGFENPATPFPAPKQVSDNNDTTVGAAGASRANLAISGGTAVLAYEETKGDGSSGKQVIYHSFPYATPQTDNAGTVISNTFNNARRVRFLLQGNEALDPTPTGDGDGDAADGDTKGVHVVLLWRESTTTEPAAAADIILRRGIKDTVLRPTSTGFLPTDVTADAPVNLSDTGVNDNSLAHRGVLRGDFVSVAYDQTPDKAAADAYTGTYNLFIKRSTDGGTTWSAATNMSKLSGATTRVVEPRLVGTPGTIKLPDGTATADPSDVQDRNVVFVAWGTETNEAVSKPLDIYLTRSTDQGVSYEEVQKLASGVTEQSEAQLRSPPNGKTLGALWMEHDVALGTTDVMYRNGIEDVAPPPPPAPSSGGGGGCATGGDGRFDPTLPALLAAGLGFFGWRRSRAGK